MQAYFGSGMSGIVSFDFFVRRLPPGWNFLLESKAT